MNENKTDKEALEEIESEIKDLREEKGKITQKTRFMGKHGIWATFRTIGRAYYNQKGMTSEAKTAKLRKDIADFVEERL